MSSRLRVCLLRAAQLSWCETLLSMAEREQHSTTWQHSGTLPRLQYTSLCLNGGVSPLCGMQLCMSGESLAGGPEQVHISMHVHAALFLLHIHANTIFLTSQRCSARAHHVYCWLLLFPPSGLDTTVVNTNSGVCLYFHTDHSNGWYESRALQLCICESDHACSHGFCDAVCGIYIHTVMKMR